MSAKKFTCETCGEIVSRLMNYCPSCGEEQTWGDIHGNDECYYCGTEVHPSFNYCYACGEDIEPEGWNDPIQRPKGFNLSWECDEECGGSVQEFMSYCPWCGEEQTWDEFYSKDYVCENCEVSVSTDWSICPFCCEELEWEYEDEDEDEDEDEAPRKKGGLKSPGQIASPGIYTCFNCSALNRSRIKINKKKILPLCQNCGKRTLWMRGK